MGILLTILATILTYILSPFLIIYSFIRLKYKEIGDHYFDVAVSIDQLGNVLGSPLFNDIMIKKEGFKFGNEDETISSVLGRNYQTNNLKFIGKCIRYLLDKIEKNHCINSIGQ